MEIVKQELGEPDESGRRSPHPIEGSNYDLDGDTVTGAATVILAMGAGKKAAAAIDRQLQGEGEAL